jgi:hypothetical protein
MKLQVSLVSGENLKDEDMWGLGESDPYCEITLQTAGGGSKDHVKATTHYVRNNNNPEWNFAMSTTDWSSGDVFHFRCWDSDNGKDDFLGSGTLVLERGKSFFGWIPLQPEGELKVTAVWTRCPSDCEGMSTTMASIASAVYSVGKQVGNWHLIYGADVAVKNGRSGQDKLALYKKKGSKDCVLAFSGSNDAADWTQNLNGLSSTQMCGYQVHAGFASEVKNFFATESMSIVSQLINEFCDNEVYSVGHSLGGAVATIAAACMNAPGSVGSIPGAWKHNLQNFRAKGLYTCGAPSVSTEQMTSEHGRCFVGKRMFNFDSRTMDTVPSVATPLGYVHPKVEALELHSDNEEKISEVAYACDTSDAKSKPSNPGIKFSTITDHLMPVYISRLRELEGQ